MTTSKFLNKIIRTIEDYNLVKKEDHILVAVSGGPDSTALLIALNDLALNYGYKLSCAHINHRLRGEESDRDEEFVKNLAGELNINFLLRRLDEQEIKSQSGLSLQIAARNLRYKALMELMAESRATKLALGHTATDQAETVLQRIITGTGIGGLSGIPIYRDRLIIRPLLNISREEILEFLKEKNQDFVMDHTNLEPKYLRNRLRLQILPRIKKINPAVENALVNLARIAESEDDLLNSLAENAFKRAIISHKDKRLELNSNFIYNEHLAIIRRIILLAIRLFQKDKSDGEFFYVHVEAVRNLARYGNPGDRVILPEGLKVIKSYDRLIFSAEEETSLAEQEIILIVPGKTEIPNMGISLIASLLEKKEVDLAAADNNTVFFDAEKLKYPLKIRTWKKGDVFMPFGLIGSKKLKKFFADEKIPRDLRRNIPLLISGSNILWVVGYRRSSVAIIDQTTRSVLQIRVIS